MATSTESFKISSSISETKLPLSNKVSPLALNSSPFVKVSIRSYSFIKKVLENVPKENKVFFENVKELKIFPVFVSSDFFETKNDNINLIGDAFFAFQPSFAQGASQSIESAYELFKSIENNTEGNYFKSRVYKTKMVNNRSKFNQFAFHLSSPLTTFFRNIFLKRLVKNKKFLESYLGKIYNN